MTNWLCGLLLFVCGEMTFAQTGKPPNFSRKYAFGVMGEYSNDSSHILLGASPNRKIGAIGFQYQRRLWHSNSMDFSYAMEARPVMVVSGPTATLIEVETSPNQGTFTYGPNLVITCRVGTFSFDDPQPHDQPYQGTVTTFCGRQATYAEGLSPFGFRLNFLTKHRLQPVFANYEGYMFSTREIPIGGAGAFNFTFEFGAGFEWFLSHRRSVRLEYDLHHLSNKESANQNPGVDSGFVKVTWTFGR